MPKIRVFKRGGKWVAWAPMGFVYFSRDHEVELYSWEDAIAVALMWARRIRS